MAFSFKNPLTIAIDLRREMLRIKLTDQFMAAMHGRARVCVCGST